MANNDESVANYKIVPSLLSCGTQLSPEWKAITTTDQRVYFVNRRTRSSHWFPPPEFWVSKLGLPYGWEAALDNQSKKYYINHVTRTTTREDPRSEADQAALLHMTPPQARRIELVRDAKIGFGFVAGSEKPVVIRSVIPNGPSHEKLFANDRILKVNGQEVRDAAQADVISLIKNALGRIELEVVASEDVQDTKNQHNRKSSLMSRTTRERRRSTPVSVRFADEPALVQVIGPMEPVRRSSVPLIPNVLKVFLENGQTRSFRYDSNTTAEEIFSSFSSKLDVKLMEHFSLVLSGPKKGQISYIQNNEKIAEIYTNRNCSSVNCLCKLNVAFVPKDHFELLSQDRNAFEYLYAQVTNRVVEGFYGMDLKYDLAIKLAALQIQQKAIEAAAGRPVKISVRQVEKEFGGLAKFVTSDLLHNMREKELRKILDQQIKQNENLASPGEKYMSSLQCKLHYLNLAAEMFSYGGRYFDAELVDNGNEGPSLKKTKKQHITVLVNLKYGVSQVVRGKVNVLCQLAEFHEITGFAIRVHEDNKRLLRIKLQEGKKIQLICTTLDCLDMIALITGYYKVYVDNTSNTPLPVENEEKWPFAFLRDPPVNDALPDFYSRHCVVPDVWSYPSCYQTSNTKRKTQVENSKPAQKEVFLDLSRAPPRFNETAISEEPEEDNMVFEKIDENQTDETTLCRESLSHEDLSTRKSQYDFEAGVSQTQQDDMSAIVMSDEEPELLETASSFLKNTSEEINSVNDEMRSDVSSGRETDAESEELVASGKRHRVFEKGNLTTKSAKTAPTEHMEENQEDLISELILAEEIWQEEEAGAVLVDEREEHVQDNGSFSTCATHESDSSVAVGIKTEETSAQVDDIVDEQNFFEVVMEKPVQLSNKIDHSSQSGRTLVGNNDLPTSLPSGDHCLGTTDVNDNFVINSPITKTGPAADESVYTEPVVFDADANPHLGLSVQHDPFIDTDPFRDQSPTPSPKDLGWDDSSFDSEGIKLADALEHGATPEGLVEEESEASGLAVLDGIRSDGKGRESPVAFCDSSEFELTSESSSVRDGICGDSNPANLDNFADSVASDMVCLEFDEDSDTETESAMSDEDESLWSTFPEYFHPSRRLRYSNNKQAELLLAEEDQDTDGLDSTETDRDVALLGVKDLSTAYESNSKDTVDVSEKQDGVSLSDDSEELSTASSESFEYTYEVNAEFPSESEEVSEDSGYVNFIGKNERRIEEICDQRKDTNSSPPHNVMVARDTCINDTCDIALNTLSGLNDKILKVDGPMSCSSANTTPLLDQGNVSEKNECAEMSTPRTLLESTHANGSSCFFFDDPLKDALLEKTEVLSRECRSLNYSEDKGRIPERNFSPSDWIIPSPPSPTPELQEADICIVSPPSLSPTVIEDELDIELKLLIVAPPPPSADTLPIVSGIRIASPPPLDVNDNGLDHLLYDYDDLRFLSLTDDHKIAKNNVLISARNYDLNFTEDKKIQAQKVKAEASFMFKEGVNAHKSVGMSSVENNIFDSSGNSRNTNQAPIKQSLTTHVLRSPSPSTQSSLPNPLTNCSVTLDDSPTTWKRIHKGKRISDDHPNKDAVYSLSLDNIDDIRGKSKNPKKTAELNSLSNTKQRSAFIENRSRFPLIQKPPVPPKPRIFRAATDDGMHNNVKSRNVKVQDSADSGLKSESESSKNTNFSKEKSSVKLEALRPTLTGADEQVTFRASCRDTSALNSQTTTEDITSRKEVNIQGEKRGTRRSLSVTCRSPYVPAPYSSSGTQSLNSAQSFVVRAHKFTSHTSSLLSEGGPTVNSYSSRASTLFAKNKPHCFGNEASFSRQRPPLMRHAASHPSLRDSNGDSGSNAPGDSTSRALPKPLIESPILQLSTVDPQEDICSSSLTLPPLPDSPPPPLPESSPPKLIPGFDAEDFAFGEPLNETFQNDTQTSSLESATFDLPSSAKELKFKRSLASLDYKQGDSSSNFPERRQKPYDGNTLSRSLTLTSFPPEINQRSSSVDWTSHRDAAFPDSRTKRSSFPFDECFILKDVTATGLLNSLEERQSLKAKCLNVCEEGFSKVIVLENRLEMYLNGDASKPQFSNEVKNWPLIFQNNARFLACDMKVISSSVKRGSPQVVSAVQTSLDSLEKLTESCEKTCSMLSEKSKQNGRSLVVMVREVLEQYRDIISAVKIASGQRPDHPDVEALVKKTNAMGTLIASLIRELRNY